MKKLTNKKIVQNEILRIACISQQRFMKDFKAITCDHVWVVFGLGYQCSVCDFYTGTNSVLNDHIDGKIK